MEHNAINDQMTDPLEPSFEKAYQLSLRYLGYRARSVLELKTFLSRKNISAPFIELIIERLTNYNYLNDTEFAKLFVSSRKKSNPKSIFALRYELSNKGINDMIIQSVLESESDEELAWLALCSKKKQWGKMDLDHLKKKALTYLKNRGFSFEFSLRAFEKLILEHNKSEREHED